MYTIFFLASTDSRSRPSSFSSCWAKSTNDGGASAPTTGKTERSYDFPSLLYQVEARSLRVMRNIILFAPIIAPSADSPHGEARVFVLTPYHACTGTGVTAL